jgi:glycerol-3-phosphate acyltransferase PlsY
MTLTVLLAVSAYLFGSIPLAYLLARVVKGVDLRRYGSGAVTGSNAGELMGKWALIVVGCLDILKGAAPVWAAQYLGEGLSQQASIGLAGIVGHNWSLYLNFQGGRGFTIVLGVLLATARLELLLFGIVAIFGVTFSGNVPVVMGVALLLLPYWSFALSQELPLIWGNGIMAFIVFVKRLIGNEGRLPEVGRGTVLLYRLLFDRDTKDRDEWIHRDDTLAVPIHEAAPAAHSRRRA